MDIINKLNKLKDQKSYSNPAKRTMEHLMPILSKSEELKKRWMWELLQNASDLGDDINAEFEITDTKLIFRHNGKPFDLDEAFNLIMPDSSKDEESLHNETNVNPIIGQFGTGFISTHILSKRIKVKGIVEDIDEKEYFSFSFHLNRSERTNKEFLIKSIKDSEKEYSESLTKINDFKATEFNTEFTYYLNETFSSLEGVDTINNGLKTLEELLPYVFGFRPQVKKVNILDRRCDNNYRKTYQSFSLESEIPSLKLIKTSCHLNDNILFDKLVGIVENNKTKIAINLKEIDNNNFKIIKYSDFNPLLYCAFPMIGSANFYFPVIIHNDFFSPNRERNGIEISKHDPKNREIIIEAKNAYFTFIDIIEKYKWDGAYNLFNLPKLIFSVNETYNWYNNLIYKPIINKLKNAKLIRESDSNESKFLSLSTIYMPYIDRRKTNNKKLLKQIYSLSGKFFNYAMPSKSSYKKWYSKIDFDLFVDNKLDVEELLKLIDSKYNNIKEITKVKSKNSNYVIQDILKLIQFLKENEYEKLLIDYKIIPNQNEVLCLVNNLKIDCIEHKFLSESFIEKLKSIGTYMNNEDSKDFLLHKEFEKISSLIDFDKKYYLSDICSYIDNELRDYNGNINDDKYLMILKDLFNWYSKCGISEESLKKLFQYFSLNKSQLYLNTKTSEELEYAFDIEISGKSKILAKIAKSNLTENELNIVADNPELVTSFLNWLNNKQEDNPDKELGDIGEEYLYFQLCQFFGKERVLWEDKSEFDFRILNRDLLTTMYYIDAKTTGKGIANTQNVPFYMRTDQWTFLDQEEAFDKYLIARVYKNGNNFNVKYIKINKIDL